MSSAVVLALLGLLVGGAVVATTRPRPPHALPPRLADVQAATRRWRTAGLVAGLLVGAVSLQLGTLGRGVMLAAPLAALCVLLGVVVGELRVTAPPVAERAAVLEVRRVADYLPRVLAPVVLAATLLLAALLATTTALGSADDMGRAGRSLFRQCSDVLSESRGPWPGSFYSAPLALVVLVGLLVAAVALRQVVRRPRQGEDLAGDDALRRRAAETVTAAAGLLVAVPFAGVAVIAAAALQGTSCAPTAWTALAVVLGLLVPAVLGLAAWCSGLLLAPTRLPVAPRR